MAVTHRYHASYMDGSALSIEAVGGSLDGACDNHLKRVAGVRQRHPEVLGLALRRHDGNHQLAHGHVIPFKKDRHPRGAAATNLGLRHANRANSLEYTLTVRLYQ